MWVALIGLACHRHRNKDSMFRVPIVYVHLYIHLFLWNYIYMRNATFNFLSSINFNIIWSNLQHTKCMPYTKNDCIISPSRFQNCWESMRGVCNLLCAYRAKLWIIEKIMYYPFTALEICFKRQPKIQPWHIQIYTNCEVYNNDSFSLCLLRVSVYELYRYTILIPWWEQKRFERFQDLAPSFSG